MEFIYFVLPWLNAFPAKSGISATYYENKLMVLKGELAEMMVHIVLQTRHTSVICKATKSALQAHVSKPAVLQKTEERAGRFWIHGESI